MERFIDNGDGTVTDTKTGLIWVKNANKFKPMTWKEAVIVCENMGEGWRLPDITELTSLLDYTQFNPAFTMHHPFENIQSDWYWSSTTYAGSTDGAWVVDMYDGRVRNDGKAYSSEYVWPVRAGQ